MTVFCTYCGQSFTREEHLERHILTHTNVKPFKCLHCHMAFARRDLLQRHYTVHGFDQNMQEIPAANGMMPKFAGRTPIACTNCAKTKTRCDKKFPCSRCTSRNLTCTVRSTRRAVKNSQRSVASPDSDASLITRALVPSAGTTAPVASQPVATLPDQPKSCEPLTLGSKDISVIPQQTHNYRSPPPESAQLSQQTIQRSNTHQQHTKADVATQEHGDLSDPSSADLAATIACLDDIANPDFMLDWSQLQLPFDHEYSFTSNPYLPNQVPMEMPDFCFGDETFDMMASNIGPLLTPTESPKEKSLLEFDVQSSVSCHENTLSVGSDLAKCNDEQRQRLSSTLDAWSVFRCAPTVSSRSCPKTARVNLELLEQALKDQKSWSGYTHDLENTTLGLGESCTVVLPLRESSRDKLLAITQSFLHKAFEIHRDDVSHQPSPYGIASPKSSTGSNFVLLPPSHVLQFFLRSYSKSFERFFSLAPCGILDANELLHGCNHQAASLLVLMMIAHGAMSVPTAEARVLARGLVEACRISLFDLVERNIAMSGDQTVLHAALLFTVQAAWSGDKWQIDIATGQRGMYIAMLRHSDFLAALDTGDHSRDGRSETETLWTKWTAMESRSRLVYAWVVADQELALMHDTAALFSVTELTIPMPDAECLWQAKTATGWSSVFERVHNFSGQTSSLSSGARPLSLLVFYRDFMSEQTNLFDIEMTPLQLRLLLHPLQHLVHQEMQTRSLISDDDRSTFGRATSVTRLQEIQSLLRKWQGLAERCFKSNTNCSVMQASFAVFHLISLNTVTNFIEIERLARREEFDGSPHRLYWRHSQCVLDVESSIYHCGQILRQIRSMPPNVRPAWWAAAIYRAGMVLWVNALCPKHSLPQDVNEMFQVPGPSFAIDTLEPDHMLIRRYLSKREGSPFLTTVDGSQLPMDNPTKVLHYCIDVINEGVSSNFSDGIRCKLRGLAKRWE